ncbi:MAG: glucose-6-phosphate isomerase [Planctomycetes bacterium]|jgi:glucose-6-phosphate isomerase|nr:glucose-6-phosphate isomerase [Planctomycetota bacterium]
MPTPTDRFAQYLRFRSVLEDPFVELDLGHAGLVAADVDRLRPGLEKALAAMQKLEAGAIANADEQRMVGHFWLRAPGLAPKPELEDLIASTIAGVEAFAQAVHSGRIAPPEGGTFTKVVLVGIGGSALGPMLLADAFGGPEAPMTLCVLDNTDPEGIDLAIEGLGSLQDALVVVISKSGGTPETRNGMLEVERACKQQGLAFAPRAVAVTQPGSALHQRAQRDGWAMTFPMWDWVGGRTSITSAVGLLPGALLGMDLRAFLAGAAAMDDATRRPDVWQNPATMLAAFWHHEGNGVGERAMVVLPYKDRLLLLSRYLQQLVMESLGKELDRHGKVVNQGIAVYGNKGSTDQHAYVQQLRDGRHDFFALFVRVLQDRQQGHFEVEPGVTSGDFLDGLWQGTRTALHDKGRRSGTIGIDRLDERTLGAIVALFERAVAIYAELIDVNAFHQPGVEAGKKAAAVVLALQQKLLAALGPVAQDVRALAAKVGADPADCWPILQHLCANRPEVHGTAVHEPLRASFLRR